MRQIYPPHRDTPASAASSGAATADLAAAYVYPQAGTWLRANMVASTDGAAAVRGKSAGLSGEADHELFALLRALADVVIVGAATVRVEGYGPARTRRVWADLRAGRPPSPPIAVVTRRMDLDLSGRLFTDAPPHARTIVVTTQAAPLKRRAEAARYADVVIAGAETVDLRTAIASLADRGLRRMLTEGGPRLLGQLAAAGLVDELCLTVSPLLVGGDAGRITGHAAIAAPRVLELGHVLEDSGSLFCRYVRPRTAT